MGRLLTVKALVASGVRGGEPMAVEAAQLNGHTLSLDEMDRMAPEMISSGRPVRLLQERPDVADLDYRGHPWARLLAACAVWDADCTDPRAREHAMGALRAFRRAGDVRGEGYCCFVRGSWAV